jgi:hypothetical protein
MNIKLEIDNKKYEIDVEYQAGLVSDSGFDPLIKYELWELGEGNEFTLIDTQHDYDDFDEAAGEAMAKLVRIAS